VTRPTSRSVRAQVQAGEGAARRISDASGEQRQDFFVFSYGEESELYDDVFS
jgi:hypothetical protein